LTIFNINTKQSETVDYIILSSFMFNRFYAESMRFEKQVTFYESIRKDQQLIAKFKPDPQPSNIFDRVKYIAFYIEKHLNLSKYERYIGPVIEIYKIYN